MKIEFNISKSLTNTHLRGLPFDLVEWGFDWASAIMRQDTRKSYPEPRIEAIGFIGERLFVVIFTPIVDGVRIISFRKANQREVKRYEKETQS